MQIARRRAQSLRPQPCDVLVPQCLSEVHLTAAANNNLSTVFRISNIAMWLINVQSRELKLWGDERKTPPYAILSHTWSDSEVTMQEYQEFRARNSTQKGQLHQTPGFQKIEAVCKLAAKHKLSHVWIDTCCIDKTSSAELSEAINSMFRWYKNAAVCYVNLEDVQIPLQTPQDGILTIAEKQSLLQNARWFTRGWTLQELIAPQHMEFYDKNWNQIGSKETLLSSLFRITGISEAHLKGADLNDASVATRMSWAARRHTTRVEDLAYSLLGIFDVNMPQLYGEGTRAFKRLQEEILQQNDDPSLFAWQPSETFSGSPQLLEKVAVEGGISVFAQRADEFLVTKDLSPLPVGGEMSLVGGKGVKLEVPLFKIEGTPKSPLRVAVLNWRTCINDEPQDRLGVVVQRLSSGHFVRHPDAPLVQIKALVIKQFDVRAIYVRTVITAKSPPPSNSYRPHWNSKAGRTKALAIEWYQPSS